MNNGKRARRFPAGGAGLCLCLAAVLAGCDRQEVRVYQIPKEIPPTESTKAAGMQAHGMLAQPAQVHWTLPDKWQEQPAGGMRVGSFLVQGENGTKADISIIPIQGPVGSEIDNVNRWRREIGLPPVSEGQMPSVGESVPVGPGTGRLFDLVNDQPKPGAQFKERTLAAIFSLPGTTWYLKMRGDDPVVAAQKAVFLRFLKELKFGGHGAPAPAQAAASPAPPQAAGPVAPADGLPAWKVPPGWVAEAPGSMVLAAFAVGGADSQAKVAVSVFPGDVGGTFANINRWRRQMGLPPITEAELPQHIAALDLADSKAILADIHGKDARSGKPARMVAAIVPQGGRTWFYKLTGDEPVVEREKDAFIRFVSTARHPNDR